jgi:CRP/FNR family transcriptional activator FtrB
MAGEAFDSLVRAAYLQNFPPAVDLIHEGDGADFFHILLEGDVELFARWSGRETTMATLAPIATFILAATIADRPYLMSARTTAKSRIALIPSEDVRRIFSADRAFANAIVTELADGFRQAVRNAKNLKLRSSVERLANYLVRQCEAAGEEFTLPHEKRLIASVLGMTPENLSRAFGALRAYGVQVDGARVRIAEVDAVRRLAKPTPLIDDPSF